jgi:hypothetical protein
VAGLVLRLGSLPWVRTRRRLWLRIVRLGLAGLVAGVVFSLGLVSALG